MMRALPIFLIFGTMFYWLWRVRSRRRPLPTLNPGPSSNVSIAVADH